MISHIPVNSWEHVNPIIVGFLCVHSRGNPINERKKMDKISLQSETVTKARLFTICMQFFYFRCSHIWTILYLLLVSLGKEVVQKKNVIDILLVTHYIHS